MGKAKATAAHSTRLFPRHTALPSPSDKPADESLSFPNIKAKACITDAAYWQRVCPQLHVSTNSQQHLGTAIHLSAEDNARFKQQLEQDGAFTLHADELGWQGLDWTALATAVVQLMQHGWPPSFLLMYDEVWQLVHQVGQVMKGTTGNEVNMDILAWYVDPGTGSGFSPHRDRQPPNAPSSFRADGTARYTTAWIPFTDACPDNSCLYMLPRWADPGYYKGDAQDGPDPLPLALSTKESYQSIRAYPAEAGAAVVFTHRTIHWGSKGRAGYHTPRICLALACSDDEFEPAYFDRAKHLPLPSIALRAALASGQMIVYHERFSLTPKQLALFKRTFMARSKEFHPTYQAKVLEEFVAATKEVAQQQQQGQQQQPGQQQQQQQQAAPVAANGHTAMRPQPCTDQQRQPNGCLPAAAAAPELEGAAGEGKRRKREKKKGQTAKDEAGLADVQGETGRSAPLASGVAKRSSADGCDQLERPSSKKARKESTEAGPRQSSKKEAKLRAAAAGAAAAAAAAAAAEDAGDEDEEAEGPGFEAQLAAAAGDDGSEGEVDLIDEELDAVLEARLGGLAAGFQDDFDSDCEGTDDGMDMDDADDAGFDFGALVDDYQDSDEEQPPVRRGPSVKDKLVKGKSPQKRLGTTSGDKAAGHRTTSVLGAARQRAAGAGAKGKKKTGKQVR